ncbi:MAG: tandem-95 repeat protein [Chloroflexi bacterium]|nr:tandem-95 repeat protein [Chloroflexota bacterium]
MVPQITTQTINKPMIRPLIQRLGLSLLLIAVLLFAHITPVGAAGQVTDCSTYGPGSGTLQAALTSGGTVTFTCSGTIIVPDITLSSDTVIDGTGQNVTLSGNNANRVLTVASNVTVELINLTISNGFLSQEAGAGIRNKGSLTITDTTIQDNTTDSDGGGIMNEGTLTINSSTIIRNVAFDGGGILNYGQLNIDSSTLSNNSANNGAGISMFESMSITNSVIDANIAANIGGAIRATIGTVDISNSAIRNNNARLGGGISVQSTANLTGVTLSGNSANEQGGGLYISGNATLLNSTVSDNSASSFNGGGVWMFLSGSLALNHTTITNNTNIGIVSLDNSPQLMHSIVANQKSGGDCAGSTPATSNGYNLDSDGSCNLTATTDIPSGNANLGLLANNGGLTSTHELLVDSDALDVIPASNCSLLTDQRGVTRPQGTHCDIGAFELELNSAPSITSLAAVSVAENQTSAIDVQAIDDNDAEGTGLAFSLTGSMDDVLFDIDVDTGVVTFISAPDFEAPGDADVDNNYNIQVTVTDSGSLTAVQDIVISVTDITENTAPTAEAGGPYVVNEGSSVQLDGSGSTDAEQDAATLGYAWDFDSDGQYDDATGINPTFVATDGPASLQIGLQVTDDGGLSSTASVVVTINNVTPIANAGLDQSVFRNETVNLTGSWTDPAGAADNAYTWSWDLDGDGSADDSGSANFGETVNRSTGFATDGIITLSFTVTDKDGDSSSDTVQITVVNRMPVANDQNLDTDEDTALPITLTASDDDNDALTYSVLSQPSNGTLSGAAPNLTYSPDADFNGSDSFTFQVNDGLVDSNVATVDIIVNPNDDAPVALDDSATTNEDTAVTIDVLFNDSDGDGDSLTIDSVTDPANGTVVNNGTDVTYTPDADFNGSDSFTYTISDGNGGTATATVTVTVNAVNDDPVALDDDVTTDEDTAVTIAVLFNDSDGDGDSLTIDSVTDPANGTVVNNGTDVTYTPDADFNGSDSFAYTISDGNGGSDTATVTVTVNATTGVPFATCGGIDVFETAPGIYDAPGFSGNLIVGTDGYNYLKGSNGADLILGLGGSDYIVGRRGDDIICGGNGFDTIYGQNGNDLIYGDDQADWLIGGNGNDILHGGNGWDDLEGKNGNDTLYGEDGYDLLLGGNGTDALFGGDGPDDLFGQRGDDALDGGDGNDFCKGGHGSDTLANCEEGSLSSVRQSFIASRGTPFQSRSSSRASAR